MAIVGNPNLLTGIGIGASAFTVTTLSGGIVLDGLPGIDDPARLIRDGYAEHMPPDVTGNYGDTFVCVGAGSDWAVQLPNPTQGGTALLLGAKGSSGGDTTDKAANNAYPDIANKMAVLKAVLDDALIMKDGMVDGITIYNLARLIVDPEDMKLLLTKLSEAAADEEMLCALRSIVDRIVTKRQKEFYDPLARVAVENGPVADQLIAFIRDIPRTYIRDIRDRSESKAEVKGLVGEVASILSMIAEYNTPLTPNNLLPGRREAVSIIADRLFDRSLRGDIESLERLADLADEDGPTSPFFETLVRLIETASARELTHIIDHITDMSQQSALFAIMDSRKKRGLEDRDSMASVRLVQALYDSELGDLISRAVDADSDAIDLIVDRINAGDIAALITFAPIARILRSRPIIKASLRIDLSGLGGKIIEEEPLALSAVFDIYSLENTTALPVILEVLESGVIKPEGIRYILVLGGNDIAVMDALSKAASRRFEGVEAILNDLSDSPTSEFVGLRARATLNSYAHKQTDPLPT